MSLIFQRSALPLTAITLMMILSFHASTVQIGAAQTPGQVQTAGTDWTSHIVPIVIWVAGLIGGLAVMKDGQKRHEVAIKDLLQEVTRNREIREAEIKDIREEHAALRERFTRLETYCSFQHASVHEHYKKPSEYGATD